jgi:hypothetical protein
MANKIEKSESNGAAQAQAPNPAMGLFGDMSLLRDIIMGPKVIEDNERFESVDNTIANNQEALNNRIDALERDMNSRFDRLEQLLKQNIEQVNQTMTDTRRNDRDALATMLNSVADGLKKS